MLSRAHLAEDVKVAVPYRFVSVLENLESGAQLHSDLGLLPFDLRSKPQARAHWSKSLTRAINERLDNGGLGLNIARREKIRAAYRRTGQEPPQAGRKSGPPAGRYKVFSGSCTLSEISRLPQCQVSYPTLRKRVMDNGWDVEAAATTPTRPGPAPK